MTESTTARVEQVLYDGKEDAGARQRTPLANPGGCDPDTGPPARAHPDISTDRLT